VNGANFVVKRRIHNTDFTICRHIHPGGSGLSIAAPSRDLLLSLFGEGEEVGDPIDVFGRDLLRAFQKEPKYVAQEEAYTCLCKHRANDAPAVHKFLRSLPEKSQRFALSAFLIA
jgi:hypothetical protein